MKAQIYISGALTNSSRKEFYEKIGQLLEEIGNQPYIPHLHTDPEKNPDATPAEVYKVDMMQVEKSAIVIAYVGYPSLGVGAELEHANAKGIPLILLHEVGEKVSRLALGIPTVQKVIAYRCEEEALRENRNLLQPDR